MGLFDAFKKKRIVFKAYADQYIFARAGNLYLYEKGKITIISIEDAREYERKSQSFQAYMDVQKGGKTYEEAFQDRRISEYSVDKYLSGKK